MFERLGSVTEIERARRCCQDEGSVYPAGVTGFVDTHSHMVPSGDDGVRSLEEAVALVAEAGRRGTAVQYATPHAMIRHPVTKGRRKRVLAARDRIRERLDGSVDFRLGWEITPEPWVLETDPQQLSMEGLCACLMELRSAALARSTW